MAHKILGVELGAYSIKVVVVTAGIRSSAVTDFFEVPVPPGEEPADERAARALAQLIKEQGLEHDIPHAALPGDTISLRVLDFGFTGLRRADLGKAVGAELEGQLPHDLDELVYDFDTLPQVQQAAALPEADPVFVAAQGGVQGNGRTPDPPMVAPDGTRILAAASTKERVARLLATFGQDGLEPRSVLAAPTVYARVAEKIAATGGPEARGDAVLFVDIGHARTNLCVVKNGRTLFARTLSQGGRQLTSAIAREWNLPFEEAERAKHADGFVASTREAAPSEAWARISDVVRRELAPLARDIRQTLSACQAKIGVLPVRAVACGGGSRLRGLPGYLADELKLPVGVVTADDAPRLIGQAATRGLLPDSALLAHGVALEGASGRPAYDLRKGELAFKVDFSFLRAKAGTLAACALVVLAFIAGNSYAALYKLRKEEALLDERLKTATTQLFDRPISAIEVKEKLAPKKEQSPLPKMTAFDQLVEISKHLPPKDKIKLDVSELDIRPQKITVKATTDSAAAIDELEKKLKEIDCFTDMTRGRVQAGAAEEKQFTLTIATKCM
ncbi:MAG: pilus assembly protein PilM [Deltaproteobacteria bacterium]|nr:pilus assembly protein PilM [Deltaproteobacteria bacterium]